MLLLIPAFNNALIRAGLPVQTREVQFARTLNGGRSARGAGDYPDIRRGIEVCRRSQPYHLKIGRQGGRSAGLQEGQGPHVTEQATMIGGVVRFALPGEGRGLGQHGHTQQKEDK